MLKWLLWLTIIQLCLFTFILTCWCCLAAAVINSTRVSTNGLHMICNKERHSLLLVVCWQVCFSSKTVYILHSLLSKKKMTQEREVSRNQHHFIWKLTPLLTLALSEILITTKSSSKTLHLSSSGKIMFCQLKTEVCIWLTLSVVSVHFVQSPSPRQRRTCWVVARCGLVSSLRE